MVSATLIIVVILELIHAINTDFWQEHIYYIKGQRGALLVALMIHDNSTDRAAFVLTTHHSNLCPINFQGRIMAYYSGDR